MANLKAPEFTEMPDIPMTTAMKRAGVSQPEDRHVARAPRDLPFLIDGDILQVENEEKVTVLFRWARKAYACKPGEVTFVPFEALVNQLGDPRSVPGEVLSFDDGNGVKGVILSRYEELTRLFAMYGIEQENVDNLVQKAPKLTVRTMTGQKVNFPSMLPDMIGFPVNTPENLVNSDVTRMHENLRSENEDLRERLERMESQMDEVIRSREGVTDKA